MPSRLMFVAVMATVSLVALAVVARNWSCRAKREPRPPHRRSFEVAAVPNGASVVVKTGLGDRRTAVVSLANVAAPPDGDPLAETARANLERLAGGRVLVESPRGRLLGDSPSEPAASRRGDLSGVVFGASGCCLQIEQLRAGLARSVGAVPKEWAAAEAEARKAKRGLWRAAR